MTRVINSDIENFNKPGKYRLAIEGVVERRPAQPGGTAGWHHRRARRPRYAHVADPGSRANRRHTAERAHGDAPFATAHPRDHT